MSEGTERPETGRRKYRGFGEEHTSDEWDALFGLPQNTLWWYLLRGMTLEQIARLWDVKYPA